MIIFFVCRGYDQFLDKFKNNIIFIINMETVSLSLVTECTLQQRNIFVICIRLSTEIKFFLNKQYCHFFPPKEIIYGLEYLELDETTEKIDISPYEKLNNNCNELLIYCELDIKLDRILEHILSLFKTFTLKKLSTC